MRPLTRRECSQPEPGGGYHGLKCTRAQFDRVAALSVEGLSKSAKRLTFPDFFTAVGAFLSFVAALIGVGWRRQALVSRPAAVQQPSVKEAPGT
jgi:hypothetical protein